jgi:exopolysaccharide biosynthesis polyprenyl glycosylphosphotransferase
VEASSRTSEVGLSAVGRPLLLGWRRTGEWRDPMLRRMLALADVGAACAVAVGIALLGDGIATALWSALLAPFWILVAKLCGLYDRDHRTLRHLTVDELPSILVWAMICVAGLVLFLQVMPGARFGSSDAIEAWLIGTGTALVLRALARLAWRRLTPPERTVLVGVGQLTHAIRRKLELFGDIHVVVTEEREHLTERDLGESDDWLTGVDRVILAMQAIDEDLIGRLVTRCREARVKLSVVPPGRGMFGTAVQLKHIADLPVVEYNTWDVSRSTELLKRVLDLLVSCIALVLTAPLFAAVALAIRLSGGPVFFVQTRAGRGGREFRMIKFRTMVVGAEEALAGLVQFDSLDDPVFKFKRDPRVTRLGHLLRRTSLDELPQLLNVIHGDMSLVGPRPEQVELVRRYRPEHRFRLAVKPGMTGPMQVFGRGRLSFEERLAVEREYIENLSISRDLRILALTIPSVLAGRGAY